MTVPASPMPDIEVVVSAVAYRVWQRDRLSEPR